jgi:hypothetical protein
MISSNAILEDIIKRYYIKEGMKIGKELLDKIVAKERIEMKDLCCMLQINQMKQWMLTKEKRRWTKLRFNEFNKFEDATLLSKGKINKKTFEEIRRKMNIKGYTLMRKLGITRYRYSKMQKDDDYETKIIDIEMKHIVDLIIIELKYKRRLRNRYCTKEEIEEICQRKAIQIENFLEYYSKNEKQYVLNKIILERSQKGIWIGESSTIDPKFFGRNYDNLQKGLNITANRLNRIYRCRQYKEDMVQEAMYKMYQRDGNIVKKFYFDAELLFKVLMSKARYVMLNYYRKQCKNRAVSYEQWTTDRSNILKDNTEELFRT